MGACRNFILIFSLVAIFESIQSVGQVAGKPVLIPEVMSLPLGAVIPNEVYKKYDSRSIGASIVARLHQLKEVPTDAPLGQPIAYDFYRHSEIHLYFPQSAIRDVLSSGFLNQHQTYNTSAGVFDPQRRGSIEELMTRLKLVKNYKSGKKEAANAVRPKYAIFDLNLPQVIGTPTVNSTEFKIRTMDAGFYGDVIAVLKTEVKDRTTWTPTDSFSAPEKVQTLFVRPTEMIAEGVLFKRSIYTDYYEAQIWGALDLNDIQEFRIPADLPEYRIKILKTSGIPIYFYKIDNQFGRNQRARDQLVFAGDRKDVPKNGVLSAETMDRGIAPLKIHHFPDPRLKPGTVFTSPEGLNYLVASADETSGELNLESIDGNEKFLLSYKSKEIIPDNKKILIQKLRQLGVSYVGVIESGEGYQIAAPVRNFANLSVYSLSLFTNLKDGLTRKLKALLSQLIEKGVYIDGITSKSLFAGESWGVNDQVCIVEGITPTEAKRLYYLEFQKICNELFPSASPEVLFDKFQPHSGSRTSDCKKEALQHLINPQ